MIRRFFPMNGILFAAAAALLSIAVLAAPIVIVNGSKARVRVIMRGGEPYVSARDIAKAFGDQFRLSDGKLVFGAPGGAYAAAGATAEYGKWAFNGKIRAKVIKYNPADASCSGNLAGPALVVIEVANATKDSYYVRARVGAVEAYKSDQLLGRSNSGFPIDYPGLPSGSHAAYQFCLPQADMLIMRTNDPKNDGAPLKLLLPKK